MKKALSLLLFVMIALAMSMPLYAGELKVGNMFAVKMFNGDRGDFSTDVEGTQNYATQVLATRGSYASEPGFSINWWVEAGYGGWGYDVGSEDNELWWRLIYGKWDAERFSLSAGTIGAMFGNGYNLQRNGFSGLKLDLKPSKATTVTLLAILTDENAADDTADAEFLSDEDGEEDSWMYGAQLTQKIKGGKANLYFVTNDNADDNNLMSLGAAGQYNLNGIKLSGEAATFFGENANAGKDYTGMFVNLSAVVPVFSMETRLYFAPGNEDTDKIAKYNFMKRGAMQPLQQGLGQVLDHDDKNLQLLGLGTSIYDLSKKGSGVYAAGLSGAYKASKQTTLNAGLIYAMPELDSDLAGWDSLAKLNASVIHSVSKSLLVGIGASYMTADSTTWEDTAWGSTVFMTWNF